MSPSKSLLLTLLALAGLLLLTLCTSSTRPDNPPHNHSDTLHTQPTIRPARLLFAGDMMQHGPQIRAALIPDSTRYDYSPYFQHLNAPSLYADLAICNLEVTLAGTPYSGYPTFSAPDDYLTAIANAGYDVFLTANNHCLDRGNKGLERTIAHLRDTHLTQLGTYEDSLDRALRYPDTLNVNGQKIVLLNYTYGTNGLKPSSGNVVNYIDTTIIAADILKAQSLKPHFIIACIHWGVENVFTPNASQKSLAKWLISHGVDHVIGAHPHVVQPAEVITTPDGHRHIVIYSLGNVISNMKSKGNDGGILLGLTLDNANYNLTADSAWWVAYHVAKPINSGLKNYTAFPAGTDSTIIPQKIATQFNNSISLTRSVMAKGDSLIEHTCLDWPWTTPSDTH